MNGGKEAAGPREAATCLPGRDPEERTHGRADPRLMRPPKLRAAAATIRSRRRSRTVRRPVIAKNRPTPRDTVSRRQPTPEPAGRLDGAGSIVVRQAGRTKSRRDWSKKHTLPAPHQTRQRGSWRRHPKIVQTLRGNATSIAPKRAVGGDSVGDWPGVALASRQCLGPEHGQDARATRRYALPQPRHACIPSPRVRQ